MIPKETIDPILSFIAETFSPHAETVLHDLTQPGFPIISLFNGDLTGRKVGDLSTVFGHLDDDPLNQPTKVIQYPYTYPNGRTLRASSIIIKDACDKPLYAITINFDTTHINNAITMLSQFANFAPAANSLVLKDPDHVDSDSLRNEINKIKILHHIPSSQLSKKNMLVILEELDKAKYFDSHGMVTLVSKELQLTRPTIYSYLKKVRG